MSKADSTDADAQPPTTTETTTPVNWAALWEEFGFDTEDGAGLELVSKSQLIPALECSDQDCPTGQDVIDGAVDQTILVERRTDGGALRGYVHVGGDR